jgi:hypothetical protein
MQQILNDLLIALSNFDCHRSLALLAESVAEYNGHGMEISDYVWTRKQVLPPHTSDAKIADFAAKRRSSEAAIKPGHEQRPA